MIKHKRIVIIVLGKSNSGKSSTWYEIFERKIRTGRKKLIIEKEQIIPFVKNSSFEEMGEEIEEDVFIKNASFEEYGGEAEDLFNIENFPNIIFCSVQYTEKGIRTVNWFKENGYFLYIQWLNPGYFYQNEYPDFLEFEKQFSNHGIFTKHSGYEKEKRTKEILQFLANWIISNRK